MEICGRPVNGRIETLSTTIYHARGAGQFQPLWEANVSQMLSKANSRLFLLRRLGTFHLSALDLLKVYTSFVRPVVEYCVPVWNAGLTCMQVTRLERVQKRALRTILRGQYTTYDSALQLTGLETLSDRREDLCRKFANKLNPELLPPTVGELHGRNTRNCGKLRNIKCRTNRYKNSPVPYLVHLLNN
ncbi:Hypp6926 [Branchiostoma lanceolatum]|uniref:Hypp6926 protein n=1 Tax=Branchiostoma lanceolatum TaxID=7740 RepID=A0A8J9YVZ5_BRALA|nr:Hypp6926 [Branchiostoma lanceolatum]